METRGMVVLAAAAVLGAAGLLRVDGVMLALAGAALAALGLAWVLGRRNGAGLRVDFDGPKLAVAGERVRLRIRLQNPRSWLDGAGLRVEIEGPGGLRAGSGMAWVPAGSWAEEEIAVVIPHRGVGKLVGAEVSSEFPWGWWRFTSRQEIEWSMTVLPRARAPREISAGGVGHALDAGQVLLEVEAGIECRGMRDFRSGDRMRWVSWAASARSMARGGGLLVREVDPPVERAREVTLVFHSAGGGGGMIRPDRFERALEWFWGETLRWVERGVPVRWLADFDEWVPREIRSRREAGEAGGHLAAVRRAAGTERHELEGRLLEARGMVRVFSDMPAALWMKGLDRSVRRGIVDIAADAKGGRR
jgi:uncharacterized protein (DUF58 family)